MKKIILAQSAGFCFGVNRALESIYKLMNNGTKVVTLGPIIHNPQIVQQLENDGIKIVDSPENVPKGTTMVIRSHGVPASVKQECQELGVDFHDATCPFVAKIHKIVGGYKGDSYHVFIAGDENHPEVQGIMGNCECESTAFLNSSELADILERNPQLKNKQIILVAQTTFSITEWKKSVDFVRSLCTKLKIFDTICDATARRQSEAVEIAKNSDIMLVLGGKSSSNTNKLKEVCKPYCDTYLVETHKDLPIEKIKKACSIGVTAGASTPAVVIKEAIGKLENLENAVVENKDLDIFAESMTSFETNKSNLSSDQKIGIQQEEAQEKTIQVPDIGVSDESFEAMLEDSLKSLDGGRIVTGTVVNITPTEVFVDIGRKQAGIIPASELSFEDVENPEDVVKVGDKLELMITKTNDSEGTAMLSKKRVDSVKVWDEIKHTCENNQIIKCKVTEIIKGGVVARFKGIRVFIPASQASDRRVNNLDYLKDQEVDVRIIEFNKNRKRAVASIRVVLEEKRKQIEDKLWSELEVGRHINGTVTGLTSYGAFVDIGGIDGLLHMSELSWEKIKSPSELVKVGDEIDVYVKALDREANRISLGHKDPAADPWKVIERDYPVGSIVEVKIVSLTSFGAFASIIPGIEGLIHISQISNRRIDKPQDAISVGDTAMAMVTSVDIANHRVGLSIRKLLEDAMPEKKDSRTSQEYAKDLPENIFITSEDDYQKKF